MFNVCRNADRPRGIFFLYFRVGLMDLLLLLQLDFREPLEGSRGCASSLARRFLSFSFTRTIRLAVRVKVTVVRTLKQSYARRGVDVGAGADVVAGAGDCGVGVDSDVAVDSDSDSVADDCGVGADADAVVAVGIVVAVAASSGCQTEDAKVAILRANWPWS